MPGALVLSLLKKVGQPGLPHRRCGEKRRLGAVDVRSRYSGGIPEMWAFPGERTGKWRRGGERAPGSEGLLGVDSDGGLAE